VASWRRFDVAERGYAVATLHRPSNVDDEATLGALMQSLADTSALLPVIFPVHPRTRARLDTLGADVPARLHLCEPLPYLEFLSLTMKARVVLTDSGGIQEETTCLGVPCLTLRENTERPITVTHGTNRVIGTRPDVILKEVHRVLLRPMPAAISPPLWDGGAAARIVEVFERTFATQLIAS
jgi:UDP-N-acetylglucosamine 2-epimerase (non-hydrolysing)